MFMSPSGGSPLYQGPDRTQAKTERPATGRCAFRARAKITSGFSESFRRGIVTWPKIRNPNREIGPATAVASTNRRQCRFDVGLASGVVEDQGQRGQERLHV